MVTARAEAKPGKVNLLIYQGDTPVFQIVFRNLDLTGADIAAQVRSDPEAEEIILSFELDLVSVEDEVVEEETIKVSTVNMWPLAEDSAALPESAFWDFEMIDTLDKIRTLLAGTVSSPRQVTRV